METTRDIHEIEKDIARYFGIRENIIVPNVSWGFFKTHEADMIVISKSGYMTEVEIKRSYADFLADFKKTTNHFEGKVDKLYYCVPASIYEKVRDFLIKEVRWSNYGFKRTVNICPVGIMTYTDNGDLKIVNAAPHVQTFMQKNLKDYKLYLEEQLAIARLGTMRYWSKQLNM